VKSEGGASSSNVVGGVSGNEGKRERGKYLLEKK